MNSSMVDEFITRHTRIADGEAEPLALPRHDCYGITSLEAGSGKTTLAFNLSYLAGNVLAVDASCQGKLTELYYADTTANVKKYTPLPASRLIPAERRGRTIFELLHNSGSLSQEDFVRISSINRYFKDTEEIAYFIPSDVRMAFYGRLGQQELKSSYSHQQYNLHQEYLSAFEYSHDALKRIIKFVRDANINVFRGIIDTPPDLIDYLDFVQYACDALVIPVKAECKSVDILTLMLEVMANRKDTNELFMGCDSSIPPIQLIVLTHGGWSTRKGDRNKPDQLTISIATKVLELVEQYERLFSTQKSPLEHLVILDDFGALGNVQLGIPLAQLGSGKTFLKGKNRKRVEVSEGITKQQNQLKHIRDSLWSPKWPQLSFNS